MAYAQVRRHRPQRLQRHARRPAPAAQGNPCPLAAQFFQRDHPREIYKREPYGHLVPPYVKDYIERYGLYRGRIPSKATKWTPGQSRILIFADQRNLKARALADKLHASACVENPDCVVAIGGDGTMIRAIRQHWRLRVPFFGINAGHLGFLLNDTAGLPEALFPPDEASSASCPCSTSP